MSYIPKDLQKFAEKSLHPVIIGGGTGTTLMDGGCELFSASWSGAANLTNFEDVDSVTQRFHHAGVQVLSTNTFRTAEPFIINMLKDFGLSVEEFAAQHEIKLSSNDPAELAYIATKRAVDIAVRARETSSSNIFVAGSCGPLSQSHALDRTDDALFGECLAVHRNHIKILKENAVDVIAIETIPTLREALTATQAAVDHNVKHWLSFALNPETGRLFDGTTVADAVRFTQNDNRFAIMFNCTEIETVEKAVIRLLDKYDGLIGVYPNGNGEHGHPHEDGVHYMHNHDPVSVRGFARKILNLINLAPDQIKFAGGCCGIDPHYMDTVRELVQRGAVPAHRTHAHSHVPVFGRAFAAAPAVT